MSYNRFEGAPRQEKPSNAEVSNAELAQQAAAEYLANLEAITNDPDLFGEHLSSAELTANTRALQEAIAEARSIQGSDSISVDPAGVYTVGGVRLSFDPAPFRLHETEALESEQNKDDASVVTVEDASEEKPYVALAA